MSPGPGGTSATALALAGALATSSNVTRISKGHQLSGRGLLRLWKQARRCVGWEVFESTLRSQRCLFGSLTVISITPHLPDHGCSQNHRHECSLL